LSVYLPPRQHRCAVSPVNKQLTPLLSAVSYFVARYADDVQQNSFLHCITTGKIFYMPASVNAGPKSITAFEIDPIFNFAGYNRQVPFQLPVLLINTCIQAILSFTFRSFISFSRPSAPVMRFSHFQGLLSPAFPILTNCRYI
jgi:hypothetical protein